VTISARLADYVASLRYADLPGPSVEIAKSALLDQLGCQLAGSVLPWTEPACRYMMRLGGRAEASIVNQAGRVPAAHAAFVNAVYGQGAELDDYAAEIGAHSGSVVLPCALAMGEREYADGQALLTAIVAGYDVACFLGLLMRRQLHQRGYHTHAVFSVFSAAAVAGRLLRLPSGQLRHAFGIAGSHASGTMEYDQSGGEVKRVHSGMAARDGIESATLAAYGLTGPTAIFEGRRGILRVLAGIDDAQVPLPPLAAGAGLERAGFKLYPTTATQQLPIALLAGLMRDLGIGSSQVRQLDVYLDQALALHIGGPAEPSQTIEAQFSLPFSLALRLARGRNDLEDYMAASAWADPAVRQAARLVRLHPHAVPQPTKYACRLVLTLADGRIAERAGHAPKGHPDDPLTRAEIEEKFARLAGRILPQPRIAEIIELVGRLDDLDDIRGLMCLVRLRAPGQDLPSSSSSSA
jgi:2-methylcitrate dehydratase PrpD